MKKKYLIPFLTIFLLAISASATYKVYDQHHQQIETWEDNRRGHIDVYDYPSQMKEKYLEEKQDGHWVIYDSKTHNKIGEIYKEKEE